MVIVRLIKILARKSGGFLFGPGSVPKGVNLFHDMKRYGWDRSIHTIIDAGANIGQFASSALTAIPSCSVLSFEPVSSTFFELEKRAKSKLRWQTFNAALGRTRGKVRMTAYGQSEMNHVLQEGDNTTDFQEVAMTTVDEVCREKAIHHIGMLKTDTEGYDAEVLLGAEKMLQSNSVCTVLCEVCFNPEDHGHSQFAEIQHILGPKFKVAGFYDQGCDAPFCAIDRMDVLFINTELLNRGQ